ncbi:MAG TPA: HAD-IC family P-type ATPase [Anaerolineae bacterium]|nr:HAD-IC family P-type ATPase [Anaerolineae bacterium]
MAVDNSAWTNTSLSGLAEAEVNQRRSQGLGNQVPPPTGRTYAQIFRENIFTFINMVIFILGMALVIVGRPGDALISLGVISANVLVSVVQEIRAKRTLDRIAVLTRPTAQVIRDAVPQNVSPDQLVVGDVLQVNPGDQIVLDGRVIGDGQMQVDESQLTGESNLVHKQNGDAVFSGSFCVNGSARYVAEKVGEQSLSNQITAGARAFRRVLTPLQQEIYLVVRIMLAMVIYIEFLLVIDALVARANMGETIASATLVVGLVPNGLFLSITLAYALGAVRIIQYGALVQQSNAIESLSNVTVLCSDKTGTLTANRLQVDAIHPIGLAEDEVKRALSVMVASAKTLNKTSEAIKKAYPAEAEPPIADVPFSSARKWSAVAIENGIYAMGAPEMLQPYLGQAGLDTSAVWQEIKAQSAQLTDRGLRVLLIVHHPDPKLLLDQGDDSHLPDNCQPIGLISLSDELRAEAKETLQRFIAAGVQPKIISGDNPETVAALAKQAGLPDDIVLVSGLELNDMSDEEFAATAQRASIFGRITPQQKEKLVDTLRQQGYYVAMIGDGVNDVLSLKKSNLGIAMESGTQATRAVADIILMKDSFAALAPAVSEGQRIVNGMQDILRLFLTRILSMALLIVSSLVIGQFPLALRNGSIVTLFSVGIPAVMLAFWARPGPRMRGTMFQRLAHFIVTPVILTSICGVVLFYAVLWIPTGLSHLIGPEITLRESARLIATMRPIAQTALASFLVLAGLLLVIFVEPPTEWWTGGDELSGDWRPTIMAVLLIIVFFIVAFVPALRNIFALQEMTPFEWVLVCGTTIIWMFAVRFFWRHSITARFLGIKYA